jgi:hypothetical protein
VLLTAGVIALVGYETLHYSSARAEIRANGE